MANSLDQVLSRVKQILKPVASNAMAAASAIANPVGAASSAVSNIKSPFTGQTLGQTIGSFRSDPMALSFTRSMANIQPNTQQLFTPFVGQQNASDLGFAFRGATQLTPFQAVNSLGIDKTGQKMYQNSAPQTTREKQAQGLGRTAYGYALTAPIGGANLLKNTASRILTSTGGGAVIGGAFSKATGGSFAEGAKSGADMGLKFGPLGAITNPLTSKLINGVGGGLVANQLGGRTIGGLANMVENEIMSKVDGLDINNKDRAMSFIMGAALSQNGKLINSAKLKLREMGIKNPQQAIALAKSRLPENPMLLKFSLDGQDQVMVVSKQEASDWTAYLQSQNVDYKLNKLGSQGGFAQIGKTPKPPTDPLEVTKSQVESAKYIIQNNGFKDFQIKGILGQDQKYADQSGIPSKAWKQASKELGITEKSFEEVIDGNYYIKDNPKPPTDPLEALKVEARQIKQDYPDPVQNPLYDEMRNAQEKLMAKVDSLGGKYKSDGEIPKPILKELNDLRAEWNAKAETWRNTYSTNQSQLPKSNKIPVKRDLTQQVAESVTGKRLKVKPSPKVEAPTIAPMAEPEIVKSNARAKQAGVPSREVVRASLPQKLDSFIQDTLGYTTQAPTGGTREASRYTKLLRSGQAKVTSAVERGMGSENPLVRNAASTMQNFFRGLGMSPERAAQSAELRGGLSVSTERAFNVMNTLYEPLGKNKTSLARVNAVLDPDISKIKVKLSDLTPEELAVHNLIRKGLDYVHDTNYANGFISEKVYRSNLGKYTPRKYVTFEMPEEINQFAKPTKKIDVSSYKQRKGLNAWKIDNSLNDPVYALGKALAQTESNVVIKRYTDYLANQPGLITDTPRPGFTKLSDSPAYGALKGKYVLNSAAEDLKGFFYASEAVNKLYDVFKAYDRLPIRQLQKKLLTVFNPTTNVGNIVSDQIFGWGTGVDPLTLNKNLYQIKKKPELYKQLADYLMSKGIVGTDITRTDFVSKLSSIDDLAESVDKPKGKIRTLANKAQSFYGGTDDAYKTAAFKSLLDKGFSLEEATRKVADGFQNYATAGKFYDTWAKAPLVGSPFIKFQGDLMRIIKNTAVNNPLGLIAFLGTLQAVAYLSSKVSGETPEDYKTRTERFAAPMIPGLNIPLTWQTPIGEINVARYISPFYANNDVTGISKMIPFAPNIDTKKDIATNIALNTNDPLLAPIAQTLVNRDFRGKPISDPNETKWSPSTLTGGEKLANQAKFAGRAYLPPQANSIIDVGSALQGKPNMYGATQTPGQAVARVAGVKISQFGPQEAQNQRINDSYYAQKKAEGNLDLEKAVTKDLLSGKIDQKTANKRIANITKSTDDSGQIGEGITQLSNGSYATLIDGKLKEFDSVEEAVTGIQKYKFKQSGKNIEIIGDTVWRRSKDGDVTSEPKIDYDTKMTTQKLENAKLSDDYKTWQDLAFTQLQNFQTQMQDPTLDELEKGDLQQKIDKLITDALKYQEYGGFKKPKKAKKPPAVKKMQAITPGKLSFKMKRDSSSKKSKIKLVSSKPVPPPKVSVGRFKVKKA